MNKVERIILKAFNYWLFFIVNQTNFAVKLNLYGNLSIKIILAENGKVQTKLKKHKNIKYKYKKKRFLFQGAFLLSTMLQLILSNVYYKFEINILP